MKEESSTFLKSKLLRLRYIKDTHPQNILFILVSNVELKSVKSIIFNNSQWKNMLFVFFNKGALKLDKSIDSKEVHPENILSDDSNKDELK